ncbi:DUF6538 domain-containing protein [Devosia sp. Leaf420]|uniref:DUF6538 domain-containing protein n=1 Tax=Devosia sp. Leaf420 TaxID=1736374 RepID=UPI0012E7ED1D|nr:DUF6538 domain-containing protein [Devosia sp. Leaf420]
MTLPWMHPTTKVWYARLWVPVEFKPIVKKDEIRRSLRTKELPEAKRRFTQVVAEIEAEWQQMREAAEFVKPHLPERSLSQMEAHGLAGEIYRSIVELHRANPGHPEQWEKEIAELQRVLPARERTPGAHFVIMGPWSVGANSAARILGAEVRAFLDARNDNLDAPSFVKLCSAVALAKRDAYAQLLRNSMGDFTDDPKAGRFPPAPPPPTMANSKDAGGEVDPEVLLKKWRTISKVADKTYKSWSGKLRMLMAFAKKTDVATLTSLDVERWRDRRLEDGINPKTVSLGDLAAVRNILGFAAGNTAFPSIRTNVAADVKLKIRKKTIKLRESSFTFEEAHAILSATLMESPPRFTEARRAARRWVPWICAYTGARVGEIGQMHSSRIFEKATPNGRKYWCMLITPEDGSTKNNEARTIPIHSHIIEQGFLNYVKKRQKLDKPLFYEPELNGGSDMHRQADKVGERLAEWVRNDLKIRGVQPNHAWRHRFETLHRSLKIREDITDHITGHSGEDISRKYGDYLVETLSDAIEAMPRHNGLTFTTSVVS